ncbi:hypothetical protein [Streptomyces sp. NBC_00826]|uniref:hypothetical protein n=1 Tax=Streptomyces sp. NBC_00826 TaxID=2975845 RepID=UPI002F9137DB|nr:hypothetical protein OG832_45710 [Streptomyces sp. NBC_00826]
MPGGGISDLDKNRALEQWLEWQLRTVRGRIRELEVAEQQERRRREQAHAALRWKIQPQRSSAAIASASPTREWKAGARRIRSSAAALINPAWIAAILAPRTAPDPSPSSRSAAWSSGSRMLAGGWAEVWGVCRLGDGIADLGVCQLC